MATLTAVCRTDGCPEEGIPKSGSTSLIGPGEQIFCGECQQPMEITEGATPDQPDDADNADDDSGDEPQDAP